MIVGTMTGFIWRLIWTGLTPIGVGRDYDRYDNEKQNSNIRN